MLLNSRRALLILLLLACSVTSFLAQVAKKRTTSKGPRAVALLQITDSGRARLLPVVIMIGNDFYDASAYKADPVPMALQSGTVYEAVKAGVSQGLFTVGGAAQARGNWFADGKWITTAQMEADKAKVEAARKVANEPKPDVEIGGPPKLRRAPGSESPGKAAPPASSQPASSQPSTAPASSPEPTLKRPTSSPDAKATGGSPDAQATAVDDPNRPVLRRQPVSATTHEQTKSGPDTTPLTGPLQFIAAVSDADGPEPRPYTFTLKQDEEQNFQKKMLTMAADEVRTRSARISGTAAPEGDEQASRKSRATARAKTKATGKSVRPAHTPEFHDVQMRAFDVANNNEAVLVLTAGATQNGDEKQYQVAVVAREDIYGDLHKVFAQTTDNQHLDIMPRYDFIDAVDADGDGRAELLFRETWDSGTAYALYRVIGDRLWPLFEGKPGT